VKRRPQPQPAPKSAEPSPSAEPEVQSWAVAVRQEGGRTRCIILALSGTRVVAAAAGDLVDRSSAIGYAENAVHALACGREPHLPNATLRELE
jgi:hypothetical protein